MNLLSNFRNTLKIEAVNFDHLRSVFHLLIKERKDRKEKKKDAVHFYFD